MLIKRFGFWLLIGVVLLIPLKFVVADISKGTPDWVKKDIENQIETILGEENRKGIPLVDPAIDWNNYKSWPKEFFYKGNKFILEIPYEGKRFIQDQSGFLIDPDNARHSIEEIPAGTSFGLGYYPEKRDAISWLEPRCTWRSNSSVLEKSLGFRSGGKNRGGFSSRYRPTGELIRYGRYDIGKQAYQDDYFDKVGNVIGSLISPDEGDRLIYEERGTTKDLRAYHQMMQRLNQENPMEQMPVYYQQ